jgi:ArsR family transcriptional regulator, arsenate/arsenite/antimonite-responsive transcriptional repressor
MEIIYSSIKDIEGLYRTLADESRLKILFMLTDMGEVCVNDIQQILKVPQPTVSRHLSYLKRMGLIDNNRKGKWNYYFIVKQQPEIIKQQLHMIKSVQSYRKIFVDELTPRLNRLAAKSKSERR